MELGKCSIAVPLLLAVAIAAGHAQPSDTTLSTSRAGHEEREDRATFEKNMDMGDVIALFREQQQEIAAQRKKQRDSGSVAPQFRPEATHQFRYHARIHRG